MTTLTAAQRVLLKKRLRAALRDWYDRAFAQRDTNASESWKQHFGDQHLSSVLNTVAVGSKEVLLVTAQITGVAVPTEAEAIASAPPKTPQDAFNDTTTTEAPTMPLDTPAAAAPSAPVDTIEADVAAILAPLGSGDFTKFRGLLQDLAVRAATPVVKEVVKEVERVVTVEVPAPPAGCRPHHMPQRIDAKTAKDLTGIGGQFGNIKLAIWDAPDAPRVDPDYIWPDCTGPVLTQLRRGRNIMLWGPRSTGKTSFARQFAAVTGRPFVRIQCNATTEAPPLLGMTTPTGWQDGQLTKAIRRPGTVILIDEPSAARPGALMMFQAMLDDERAITIDETGERVPLAEGVVVFLADNTGGLGDPTGLYEGTQRLNLAFLDRAGVAVHLDFMPTDKEAAAVAARTKCPRPLADMMVNYASITRRESMNGKLTTGLSLRRVMSLCELLADGVSPTTAFDLAVFNSAPLDDREALRQLWQVNINKNDITAIVKA